MMLESKYYKLEVETDRKKVGQYPQVHTAKGLTREKLDCFSRLSLLFFIYPSMHRFD